MAWVAVAVTVIGAGVSAYGQYQSGQAQKAMANYNAKLAENDAIAKQQAIDAETQNMRSEKKKMEARQRASFAKGGGVATGGTALLVQAEQAGLMELDILQMQRTGKMDVQSSMSERTLSKYQGKQAGKAGTIGAVGSLISGAGSAYGAYSSAKAPSTNTSTDGMTLKSEAPASVRAKYGWNA